MKKTIFHMIRSNVTGGSENVFLDYCKILQDEFELVCLTTDKFIHLDEIKKLGIKTETLRYRGVYDFISVFKFFFLVKKYSPDLVLAHNGRAFCVINLFNKIFKKRCFKTVAVNHLENPKRMVNLDYIITVAKHLADEIREEYKDFPSENLLTIHNGTKVNYNYNPKNKPKNENFTFGTLSRIAPVKNITTAIKAFKLFLKDVPNAQLKIAGDGSELENLKDLVKKENLENNVHFIGYVNNTEEFFNGIDLLLHPSLDEGLSLVVLEAFNYYTPIIASDANFFKQVINNRENGYLYENPPISEQNLYQTMHKYYFEDIKNKDKIVNQARKDLEEKFSLEVTKKNLISTLQNIIGGRK